MLIIRIIIFIFLKSNFANPDYNKKKKINYGF